MKEKIVSNVGLLQIAVVCNKKRCMQRKCTGNVEDTLNYSMIIVHGHNFPGKV